VLVAFGGAGRLHVCAFAASRGVPRVIVPALPGALSAFGILVSDIVKDYSRTVLWRVADKIPVERLEREFANLQHRAGRDFRDEGWRRSPTFQRSVDIRYQAQGYELNVPYTRNLIRDFRHEHHRRYGYIYPARTMELVTVRLRAKIKSPQARLAKARSTIRAGTIAFGDSIRAKNSNVFGPVYFAGKKLTAAIYNRDSLRPEKNYSGPAVITEYSATTVVSPRMRFRLEQSGNLLIEVSNPSSIRRPAARR